MDCTVLIAGGGPAGVSTWLHLHQCAPHLAEKAVLIDKQFFPRDKLCAGALNTWSIDTLDHLGVNLKIPCVEISDVEFRFKKESHEICQADWFKIIQRIDFDDCLVQNARDRGLQIHEGESLVNISRRRKKLLAITDKGEYTPKVIVGAEGAFSLVRRIMMPSRKLRFAPTIQMTTNAEAGISVENESSRIILDLTPVQDNLQGYVWYIPNMKAGKPATAIGIVDFRIYPERTRPNLKNIFESALLSRKIDPKGSSWASHPIHWFSGADTLSVPNVILVGDAAGIEPAFGGGIHLSLSYGDLASQAIIDAFDRQDFSFKDYRQRFDNHSVGGSIYENSRLALQIYNGQSNPLSTIRNFFARQISSFSLLDLLLAGSK